MEITIREKNQGPTVGIKKNDEVVLESGQAPVAAPAPEEETNDEIKKVE